MAKKNIWSKRKQNRKKLKSETKSCGNKKERCT